MPVKPATFQCGVNVSHWLSLNSDERPYGADWFNEHDMDWIAQRGFDHVRISVDGRLWQMADGCLDERKIEPFEKGLRWARQHGLSVILDMHMLPGVNLDSGGQDATAFANSANQAKVAGFWRRVARRFASQGDDLRFEILNEPDAPENKQLNTFNRAMLAAIRESNPTRVVYVTSNRGSHFSTVDDVAWPDDEKVALTLHFYEPLVFTHQRATWIGCPSDMPLVRFPGVVQDLHALFPAGHSLAKTAPGELAVAQIDAAFARVAEWVRNHVAGTEVHIGGFGVYDPADADSKRAYVAAVRRAAERQGWGWAVWDYKGGFAVRDQAGNPTPVLEGLFGR